MLRNSIRLFAFVLVCSLTTVVVIQRQSIARLQREVEFLREESQPTLALEVEYPGLSNSNRQTPATAAEPNEPPLELLRLRGEVGRLRRDQNEVDQLRNEVTALRQEIRVHRGPTLNEMYGMRGLETNSLPEVDPGTMQPDVLKELRRVNAKFLEANEAFIHAQVFPRVLVSSNGAVATITMEFYFREGKLVSRKDTPTGIPPWPPNPFE